jgi:FtsZ-binding cell division protein ZapB
MLELSSDELKEYAEWLSTSEKMTAQQREELAGHRLNALLEAKQREMQSFLCTCFHSD